MMIRRPSRHRHCRSIPRGATPFISRPLATIFYLGVDEQERDTRRTQHNAERDGVVEGIGL